MRRQPRQHAGFTLIELLVAVSILGLMLFLINQLFQSSQVAIGTAMQQSKAIAATRIIGEQMNDDFSNMVGPVAGSGATLEDGYIVIINQRLRGMTMRNPQNLADYPNGIQTRADQILFVRDATALRSMTPMSSDSYGSNLAGQAGDVATVWYGLVERTEPDGTPRNRADNASRVGGANAGLDRVASDLILGRHTMLFNPTDVVTGDKVSAAPNEYTHAESSAWGSLVQNTNYPNAGLSRTFMGLTDVTRQDYRTRSADNAAIDPHLDNLTSGVPATENDFYVGTAFPQDRLRVNPSPTDLDTDFESFLIAQTHGILAPGCSEFIVQFAADLNGNGRLDTFGGNDDLGGQILWYDAFNTNTLGTVNWNANTWDRPTDARFQPYIPNLSTPPDYHVFIFRVDDDEAYPVRGTPGTPQDNSSWPYLIRIRYRLHDTRGRLAGNEPGALADGLDNDGDGGIDESGEDQIAGQWYEHVYRVPRPKPQ